MAIPVLSSVFLSYSRGDSQFVDRLEAELCVRGLDVWVDRLEAELCVRGLDVWVDRRRLEGGQ